MPTVQTRSSEIDRDLWRLMGILLIGASAALLDTTIVAVAIDDLTTAFDTTVGTAQWATTSYLLAMVGAIPMMGWLTDRFGGRRVWLATLWVFLAGSLLCSVAWSIGSLIAFRVVQGLGAGLILPLLQAILAGAAGPQRIGRVMGTIGIPGQLAPILGPVLGGLIVSTLGWRWIFLVNVPLCLLAIVVAHRRLHPALAPSRTKLDLSGASMIIPSLVAMLLGLTLFAESTVAPATSLSLLAAGAVLLVAFVVHAARLGDRALLDVRLVQRRSFLVATAMMLLAGACLYGPMLLLPLFFRQARGVAAADVGWLLAPQGVGLMIGLWLAGRWTDRAGPRVVALVGTALAGSGLTVFASAPDAPVPALIAGLTALGAGLGGIGVAVAATSYRDVEPAAIPRATSLLNVVQRVGASVGTVVVAIILDTQLDHVADGESVGGAYARTFVWTIGLLAVAAVVVLFLPSAPPPPSPTASASASPSLSPTSRPRTEK